MRPLTTALSLRHRLAFFALGAAALLAAMGGASLWCGKRVTDSMSTVQERRLKPLVALDAIGRALERQRASVQETLASTNDVMQEALDREVERDRAAIPATLLRLRAGEADPAARRLLDELAAVIQRAQGPSLAAVLAKLHHGQFAEADIESQRSYRPDITAASAALDKLVATHVRLAGEDYARAAATMRMQTIVALAGTAVALLGGLAIAFAMARALHRVLGADERELARATRDLAQGRLTRRVAVRRGDATSIASSLNAMSQDFSRVVGDVALHATQVDGLAQGLARSSHDLSLRTSSQAASLEQTAASMQQLATTVERSAERAERARRLAQDATTVAVAGGQTMADVQETMHALVESEKRVAQIVAAIDAVAFQTNLLAINAAVEAARAGEEGRGFAVVAAEVRMLSQRSADAAREIRELVQDSVARTQGGHGRVAEAAQTMQAILDATRGVTEAMTGIAHEAREQSAGIVQVNRAVEQLEAVVQANAQEAEDTSRRAEEMKARAAALVESIERFSAAESRDPGGPEGRPHAPRPAIAIAAVPRLASTG
ncbi:MAG TPA: methyl-accepting chemotaxis protein [Usitatibacter sp.]|jgi:methyl-accepting chemotaxis protein|nr:methyl-accepting chemotaxis protein [Usitatibacter sp.]